MKIALGVGIGLSALVSGSAAAQYTAYNSGPVSMMQRSNIAAVGQPIALNAGTPSLTIVGFDSAILAKQHSLVAGEWRVRVRFWGGYAAGSDPIFSNLLTEQTLTSTFTVNAGSGVWGPLQYGTGWTLEQPVTVATSGPVGVSFVFEELDAGNWISTSNAQHFTTFSAPGGGPVSGSNAMPTGKGWYERSFSLPFADINFAPSDARATASSGYSGLNLRLYTRCTGDFTFDTTVDDSDFVVFAGSYTTLDCADSAMPAGCPADYNADGFVDDADFVIFAGAYEALFCS